MRALRLAPLGLLLLFGSSCKRPPPPHDDCPEAKQLFETREREVFEAKMRHVADAARPRIRAQVEKDFAYILPRFDAVCHRMKMEMDCLRTAPFPPVDVDKNAPDSNPRKHCWAFEEKLVRELKRGAQVPVAPEQTPVPPSAVGPPPAAP